MVFVPRNLAQLVRRLNSQAKRRSAGPDRECFPLAGALPFAAPDAMRDAVLRIETPDTYGAERAYVASILLRRISRHSGVEYDPYRDPITA